jgi:hypothetical protein
MDDSLVKTINQMISKAIEDCFTDSLIYGIGYIKVTQDEGALQIEHVPFSDVKEELEGFIELEKLMYNKS